MTFMSDNAIKEFDEEPTTAPSAVPDLLSVSMMEAESAPAPVAFEPEEPTDPNPDIVIEAEPAEVQRARPTTPPTVGELADYERKERDVEAWTAALGVMFDGMIREGVPMGTAQRCMARGVAEMRKRLGLAEMKGDESL